MSNPSPTSPSFTITLDGETTQVTDGTTGTDLFSANKNIVVLRVNGELKDLFYRVAAGDVVDGVDINEPDGLNVLRHSAAHVLAQAVQKVNPDAKLGIGPPIVDGFYYDFDVETPFAPEDLKKLEKEMMRIVKEGQTFQRRVITEEQGHTELAGSPTKLN